MTVMAHEHRISWDSLTAGNLLEPGLKGLSSHALQTNGPRHHSGQGSILKAEPKQPAGNLNLGCGQDVQLLATDGCELVAHMVMSDWSM